MLWVFTDQTKQHILLSFFSSMIILGNQIMKRKLHFIVSIYFIVINSSFSYALSFVNNDHIFTWVLCFYIMSRILCSYHRLYSCFSIVKLCKHRNCKRWQQAEKPTILVDVSCTAVSWDIHPTRFIFKLYDNILFLFYLESYTL